MRKDERVLGAIKEHMGEAEFLFRVDGVPVFLSDRIIDEAGSCFVVKLRNADTGDFDDVIFVGGRIMADRDVADMAIAHELGHIRHGESRSYLADLDIEIQADAFAMEYLGLSGDEARDLLVETFVLQGIDLGSREIAARVRALGRYAP